MSTEQQQAIIFDEVLPQHKVYDDDLSGLYTGLWPFIIVTMYLRLGKAAPRGIKSVTFGYCTADGRFCPRGSATHFGWTPEFKSVGDNDA